MRSVAGAGLAGDVSVGVRLARSARHRAAALDGATGWGEVPKWRGGEVAVDEEALEKLALRKAGWTEADEDREAWIAKFQATHPEATVPVR